MKTSQNRKGGKCKKVNTNGHLKENTVRDKTTQTCYATRQPSGDRPDYLQKLKVPEGYEKMIDYSNI